MLSYLTNIVRPEISMSVHMNPMRYHKLAIMRIYRYLVENQDRGITYKIDKTKGLEVYVDADFTGGWSNADAHNAVKTKGRATPVGKPLLNRDLDGYPRKHNWNY